MVGSVRIWFGSVECELGVARSSDAGYAAWAVNVRANGQLSPLSDRHDNLAPHESRDRGGCALGAEGRMTAAFGAEQGSSAPARS